MKLVIFGLGVSSSWGNGHATLWRGLCGALAKRGHQVFFFERDVPYYAATRDLFELSGGQLILYPDWPVAFPVARGHLSDADAAIVTSYCPDAVNATTLMMDSRTPLRVFYDLDTPVTLARLAAGEPVDYIGPRGLYDFDLVLSFTGGRSLEGLRGLGARAVVPLYGSVDPAVHKPVPCDSRYQADLGYLGTFAPDRAETLLKLFVEPARRLPGHKFLLAGAMYDRQFPWQPNIFFVDHLPPSDHPHFYCSARLTLNVTRRAMAETGYCPSARLFEATACGAPVISDAWEGIEQFFEPDSEIILARTTEEVIEAIDRNPGDLAKIAAAARERTLAAHTADIRAGELERILSAARNGEPVVANVETA